MTRVSAARGMRLSGRCAIQRVPAGSNPAARVTVTADLPCSAVYPASSEQAERAGMALVARLLVIYTAPAAAQPDWRLVAGGADYRIRAISEWPYDNAQFLELLIEAE